MQAPVHPRRAATFLLLGAILTTFVLLSGGCDTKERSTWDNPLDAKGSNFHPPTAKIVSDSNFRDSSKVSFKASDSAGQKGAKYLWRLVSLELYHSIPDSFRVRIDSTSSPEWNPGHLFEGRFRLGLVVRDANGLTSDSASQTLRIYDPPPVISHVRDTSLPANGTLRLKLSVKDSSGKALTTYWAPTDSTLDSTGSFSFCPMEESNWTVTWSARDAVGRLWLDTFAVDFTDKHPALVHVRDTALAANQALSIQLAATDTDGTISKYLWRTQDSVWRDSSGRVVLSPMKDTTIKVRWAARDDVGSLSFDSFFVRFANKAPALARIADTALMVGKQLAVDLLATDSDGTVRRYYYDTCGRRDSSSTPPRLVFSPSSETRKTVRWSARDDVGAVSNDSFVVTFSLDRPILTAIPDTILSASRTLSVPLSVRGLTPSSTVAKYLWTTGSGGWTDSSDSPRLSVANSTGGAVQIRWAARGGSGFLSIPDTFNARFVPAPSAPRASIDTGLVGWNGSSGSVRFHWRGAIPGFPSESVNWSLWLGPSGSLSLVHSGSDTAFAAAGLDSGAAYDYRLVASSRFGDTASVAGTIRPWYMSIAKMNPSADTAVLYSTTSLTLQARVQGAQLRSVSIGGKTPSNVSGVYSANITNLAVGANTVWVVTTDSLGNKDSIAWVVTRRPNITLTGLSVDAGTLVPPFSAATLNYRDSIVPGADEVVLSGFASGNTTVTYDGAADGTIPLADTAHTVRVVTRSGSDSLVYLVTVPPKQVPLKVLLNDRGTLLPAFSAQTTSYTDTLIYGTRSVTLAARLWDNTATVTWNGGTDSVIPLSATAPTVVKIVTSKPGFAPLTYTATLVVRKTPDIPWNSSVGYSKFTDPRDGHTYKVVAIGGQTWMAENLSYSVPGSTCNLNSLDTCEKYGRLYDWATALGVSASYNNTFLYAPRPAQGICPADWHIPTDSEWNTLQAKVGSDSRVANGSIGSALKSTGGWIGSNGTAANTDLFGFRVIPGGDSCSGGCSGYQAPGTTANFWTVTEPQVSTGYKSWGKSAYYMVFSSTSTTVQELYGFPGTVGLDPYSNISPSGKLSVRCIQN